MKVDHVYDHHNAHAEWERRGLATWLTDVFEAPAVKIQKDAGSSSDIREHVKSEFQRSGWALRVKIDQDLGLSVFAVKDDLGFHLQTGNISRAAYDLLKLQHLYQSGRIEAASLALPTRDCAEKLGSNVAHADRVVSELQLFNRMVTVPILVVAFR